MSCSFDIKPGDRHCEFCTVIGCGERDGAQYDTAATTSALSHGHYENVCQSSGSSRAEQAAVERFPHGKYDGERGDALRYACIAGYHKAEKETIGRAIKWLEDHADSYNGSESAFDHMEEEMITDFRKAMEEEQ